MSNNFPNFPGKHAGRALIEPGSFVEAHDLDPTLLIPRAAILAYSPNRLEPLLRERGYAPVRGYPPPWLTTWVKEGSDVGVAVGFGIGAPVATAVLEQMIALGVTRFVSLGIAGALALDLDFGDVVVCTSAIRDEGVSHHYVESTRPAISSPSLSGELTAVLVGRGTKFREGPTWTIDAIYRETEGEARHYLAQGVLTVDMEAAALFSVAELRGVDLVAIFTVSDHLLAGPAWRLAPDRTTVLDGFAEILDASLEVLGD
jgi:uridine phosphorylase